MILRLRCTSAVWCALAVLLAPAIGLSQTPEQVVPITAEPEHKIRFDNGKVRMYEVRLAKWQATLMHGHLADSFPVIFRETEISIEQLGGATTNSSFSAGRVGFASTEQGPYSHRVVASKDTDFHVIAMELMMPAPDPLVGREQRADPRILLVLENPRGRADLESEPSLG